MSTPFNELSTVNKMSTTTLSHEQDAMDSLENTVAVHTTNTNASDWDGAEPARYQTPVPTARASENKMEYDEIDWSNRLFSLIAPYTSTEFYSVGPSLGSKYLFQPLDVVKTSDPFQKALALYAGFSYDSIEVTMSLSNPKGITGGSHVGFYPFVPWFQTTNLATELTRHDLNDMTRQRLWLSPVSQLLTYGEGEDVKFSIPWTFPTAFLPSAPFINGTQSVLTTYGEPIVYFWQLVANYVSSVSKPAQLRVFLQFKGVKFYGPWKHVPAGASSVKLYKQSGLESAAAVGAALLVEKAVETGVSLVSDFAGKFTQDGKSSSTDVDAYEAPISVQQAYVGDSTAVGAPPTQPIFSSYLEKGSQHEILEYLKRPQYIGTVVTGLSDASLFYANPTNPVPNKYSGPDLSCTYFRWFSQAAQYWRGTINFHFVVLGHPMVEVSHQLTVAYPNVGNLAPVNTPDTASYSVLRGMTSGVAHIVVPMPNLSPMDHIPVMDNVKTLNDVLIRSYSESIVGAKFTVVSTMLNVDPTITVAVYMSAGDDFEFYQPYAIGLNNVDTVESLGFSRMEKQVQLPSNTSIFDSRALSSPPTHTLPAMETVEHFMSIWAKALPYRTYDGHDEPYPVMANAGSPVSWPPANGSAAWTLNVNNSWYNTCDFVALYSSHFLYYRGSLGCKVILSDKTAASTAYCYVGLSPAMLDYRQKVNNPYTSDPLTTLPVDANFANGLVVTPSLKQPVLDVTIPFRSPLIWSPVCHDSFIVGSLMDNIFGNIARAVGNPIVTNVLLQVFEDDLQDVLYRKAGSDYFLALEGLLPPAPLWMARGWDWS